MTRPGFPRRTVLAAAFAAAHGTASWAAEAIKVAAVDAMSGPLGYSGLDACRGAQVAADDVNAAGGIRSLAGRRLELMPYDTQSDVGVGQAAAERAIAEGAVAILGTTQSSVTMATTAIAERAGIPHIVTGSAAPEITARGYHYTFCVLATSDTVFASLFPMLQHLFHAAGIPLKSFVSVYSEPALGKFYSSRLRPLAQEAGIGYNNMLIEPGTAGQAEAAARLKALDAQVVNFEGYASDAALFVAALKAADANPALVIPSTGAADAGFIQTVGARDAEGFASLRYFNPGVRPPGNPGGPRRFHDAYSRRFGEPALLGPLGYTGLRTLAKALDDAGSIEPRKLRDALAAVELRHEDGHILPNAMVKFGANGENLYANAPYVQLVRGQPELVWPPEYATAKPALPMPTWREKAL